MTVFSILVKFEPLQKEERSVENPEVVVVVVRGVMQFHSDTQ